MKPLQNQNNPMIVTSVTLKPVLKLNFGIISLKNISLLVDQTFINKDTNIILCLPGYFPVWG